MKNVRRMNEDHPLLLIVIGLAIVLFIVFLIPKLIGITIIATWSWWWVTAPLWLPVASIISGLLILKLILEIVIIVLWLKIHNEEKNE